MSTTRIFCTWLCSIALSVACLQSAPVENTTFDFDGSGSTTHSLSTLSNGNKALITFTVRKTGATQLQDIKLAFGNSADTKYVVTLGDTTHDTQQSTIVPGSRAAESHRAELPAGESLDVWIAYQDGRLMAGHGTPWNNVLLAWQDAGAGTLSGSDRLMFGTGGESFDLDNMKIETFNHDTSTLAIATLSTPHTIPLSGDRHTVTFMAKAYAAFKIQISGQDIPCIPPSSALSEPYPAVPYWVTSIKQSTGQHKVSAGIGVRPGGTHFYQQLWSAPVDIKITSDGDDPVVLSSLMIKSESGAAATTTDSFTLSPRRPILYDWSDQWQLTKPQTDALRIATFTVSRDDESNTTAPNGLHIALHTAGDAHVTNTTYDISLDGTQAILTKRENPSAEIFAPSANTEVIKVAGVTLPKLDAAAHYWCALHGNNVLIGSGSPPLSHCLASYFDDPSVTGNKPAGALCALSDAGISAMTHFSFASDTDELVISNVSPLVTATDNTFVWSTQHTSPTPGSMVVHTRVASTSGNGEVILGLKGTDALYTLSIKKSGAGFTTSLQEGDEVLVSNDWTTESDKQLVDDLTKLYAGAPQDVYIYYHNGAFYGLINSSNFLNFVDSSPIANIAQFAGGTNGGTITYSNTQITDTVKTITYDTIATEANRAAHPIVPFVVALPETNRGLITFEATNTLSNLYAMFGNRDDMYTLRADAWEEKIIRAAVMHEKGSEKHVPTTSGTSEITMSKPMGTTYWCAFDNGKIALGLGATPGSDTLVAWQDGASDKGDCSFFSAMPYLSGTTFQNIAVTADGLEAIDWKTIMTPMGVYPGSKAGSFIANGLQNGAWHTDKSRADWAHAWEFTDLTGKKDSVTFDLTGPLLGDATLILGPQASGTTFYAFTLQPSTSGTNIVIDTVSDGAIDATKQVTHELSHTVTGTQTFTLSYAFDAALTFTLKQGDTSLAEMNVESPAIDTITHMSISAAGTPLTFANITGPIKTDVTVIASATSVETNPLGSYEYSWQDEHKVETDGTILITGQMDNARPAHSGCTAIIGLTSPASKEADVAGNGASYNVVIDYSPGATQATIYLAKHESGKELDSNKLGEMTIDVNGDDDPFNKWRNGITQDFWLTYDHGTFFFGWGKKVGLNPLWYTVDDAPHTDIKIVGFSSKNAYISYTNIVTARDTAGDIAFDHSEQNKSYKLFGALPTTNSGVIKVKATAAGNDMYFSLYTAEKELVTRVHVGRDGDAMNASLLHTAIPIAHNQELYSNANTGLKIGQDADYWLAYDEGNIAFGHGQTPGENVGFVSAIPVEESRAIRLFALHNNTETMTYHHVSSDAVDLNWGTLRKDWLTSTYGADLATILPGLNEDENGSITAFATMGHISYNSATDQNWQKVWLSPSPDNLAFIFDVEDQSGPTNVFLSNQTSNPTENYYKVTINPTTRTINVSGHGTDFAKDGATYSLYTDPPKAISAKITKPANGTYLVVYDNGTLSVKYALNRASANGSIPEELARVSLPNAPSGIDKVSVGTTHRPVTFINPTITGANGAQGGKTINIGDEHTQSAVVNGSVIRTLGIPEYVWSLQPLNYYIPRDENTPDAPGSFKVEATIRVTNPNIIDPRVDTQTNTIAIGLSPDLQDSGPTQPVLSFNYGNTQIVGFSKATRNILIKNTDARTIIEQPMPITRQSAASGVYHRNGMQTSHQLNLSDGNYYEMWLLCKQNGSKQELSWGAYPTPATMATNDDPEQLMTIRQSRTGTSTLWNIKNNTDERLEKIAFASWGAEVEYSNIKISAFDPSTLPTSATDTASDPDAIAFSNTTTEVNWHHPNLATPLNPEGGGVLKTKAKVTQTGSGGEYMLALCLSSDVTSNITTSYGSGDPVFKGADYTLLLRSSDQLSYASILKGGDANTNNDYELSKRSITNPDQASFNLKDLLTKNDDGDTPEVDIWFKYVPRKNSRTFSFGFGTIAGVDEAWKWTETIDAQNPPAVLTQFGLGTWTTGVVYKNISLAATEPLEIADENIEVDYDGTLSRTDNQADPIIWEKAQKFNVPKKFKTQMSGSQGRLRISFRQTNGDKDVAPMYMMLTPEGIFGYEGDTLINENRNENAHLLPGESTAQPGAIRTYWIALEGEEVKTLIAGVGDDTEPDTENALFTLGSDEWNTPAGKTDKAWEFAIAHTEHIMVQSHTNASAQDKNMNARKGQSTKVTTNRYAAQAAAQQ